MQIVNVGCDDASDEAQLISTLARWRGVGKLIDEFLAIVQVAKNILRLFQRREWPRLVLRVRVASAISRA